MSDKTPTVTAVPTADAGESSSETKRPNPLVRAYRKIKTTPPRTAIAVVGGVALVGAGAFLGRKSASTQIEVHFDDSDQEPLVIVESTDDTTVA